MIKIRIIQNSNIPIYKQIYKQIKDDILSGKYEEDYNLPSIRGLAKELRVSVITTVKAYDLLAEEGLIRSIEGKGYYVNKQDSNMVKEQYLRKVEEGLNTAIEAAGVAGLSREELHEMLDILLKVKVNKTWK